MLTVYSKKFCPNCEKAIALLEQKGVEFEIIKIDEDEEQREFIISEGHKSVPQIYKDGFLFVMNGYTGLSKLSDTEWSIL